LFYVCLEHQHAIFSTGTHFQVAISFLLEAACAKNKHANVSCSRLEALRLHSK